MARKFLTHLDMAKNELQNAAVQNLASAPSSPVRGQMYYNSTGGDDTLYWYDGTSWVSARGGSTGFPGFGAVTAQTTFGASSSNGVGTTTARNDHTHGTPTHDGTAHASISLSSLAGPIASLSMNSQKIVSMADGTAATDGVTKQQLDAVSAGLDVKPSVKAATNAQKTLSGTATVDSVSLSIGDRVLVKSQTAPAENGIYLVASGTWTRATDMDAWTEFPGAFVFVEQGTNAGDTGWVCTVDQGGTLDTTAVTWTQFYGPSAYSAGSGLTSSGTTFNVGAGLGVTVNADDVAVTFAGSGSANTVARSDHTHTAMTTKYATATVGGATSQVITHNLASRDVQVEVYRTATPWDTIICDVERTTTNTCTLRFSVAPATNEYTCVVIG